MTPCKSGSRLTASLRGSSPWIREDVLTCLPKPVSVRARRNSPRSILYWIWHLRERERERERWWCRHEEDTGGGSWWIFQGRTGSNQQVKGLIGYLAFAFTVFDFFLLPLCLFWRLSLVGLSFMKSKRCYMLRRWCLFESESRWSDCAWDWWETDRKPLWFA
jgi:hypothetical protein